MIVIDHSESGWLLVPQVEHAELSAQIAEAWRPPDILPPKTWDRVIEATRHHDDGWAERDADPLCDDRGRPLDFLHVPTPIRLDVWRRSIATAEARDPYIGLMVIQHGRWLYTQFSGDETDEERRLVQDFLDETTLKMARRLQTLMVGDVEQRKAVQPGPLQAARRLVSFFDAASLRLLEAVGEAAVNEPVIFDDRESIMQVANTGEEIVCVSPWPFSEAELSVHANARHLTPNDLAEAPDPSEALASAASVTLTWTLQAAPAQPHLSH